MGLALMVFIVVLMTTIVFALLFSRSMHKRDVDQIKDRLTGKQKTPRALKQTQLIKNESGEKRSLADRLLGADLQTKLRTYIEQGGLAWEPAQLIHASLFLALVFFNIFWYVIPHGRAISPIGMLIGASLPFVYIWQKRSKRLSKIEEQFPESLEFVSRAMRAGHAFSVSLEMLHKEFPEPVAGEFRRTFEEQNLGLPLEIALEKLGQRVPLIDVHFFVSAVLLQKRTGGNLAELLDNLAYLIRERFKLRGQVRAISAHGRISGMVLSMIPLVVAILMFYTNPDYVMFFINDPTGKILMVTAIGLQFLGFLTIRKIIDIGV
ncbi:MAG TPA: type II secretion system F family protein [Bryobacterales bacterium]|nr:type II secretion system F family protein [Bryobacterales bacterium]